MASLPCLFAAAFVWVACFAASLHAAPAPRNLFAELLGKTEAETTAKLEAGWQQLFYGNNDDERLYYPAGEDMAYIADVNNRDVRSEGISYGLMIAVQMDRRAEFDRIYRWAKRNMQHTAGPRRGYFAWQCAFDGRQIDPGSASDGEEWIATALLFAAQRWQEATPAADRANQLAPTDRGPGEPAPLKVSGASGESERPGENASPDPAESFDYLAEAQALLRLMLHKPTTGGITSIFDREEKQVVFSPTLDASRYTDPSYHLPAFYEVWARWAEAPADRAFWADAARTSRAFFHRAAHPKTGLMPEYAHFDGRPYLGGDGTRGDFRYDAWRTLANVAFDYANFAADPWQIEQSNRVLRFLESHAPNIPYEFTRDGTPLVSGDASAPGLIAMAAVAGLAADPGFAQPFVQRLWDLPIPRGRYRYYDGLLYQLGLLQASGRFLIDFAHGSSDPRP